MMNRAVLIGACVLLAGCAGGGQDDLEAWMGEQAKTMRGAVRPLPELRQVAVVAYAGTQGDDPFRSARMEPERRASASALRPDLDRRREPLEAFPLDAMNMVGSMSKTDGRYAILKVEGLLYYVKRGDHLGQNFGRVLKVEETELTLRELLQDPSGDMVEKLTTLQLQEAAR